MREARGYRLSVVAAVVTAALREARRYRLLSSAGSRARSLLYTLVSLKTAACIR